MKQRIIMLAGPKSDDVLTKGAHQARVMKLRAALELHDVQSIFIGDGEVGVSVKQIEMALEAIEDPQKPTTVIIYSHGEQKQGVHYIALRDVELDSTCNVLKLFTDKLGSNVEFFITACESEGALAFSKNMLSHSIIALSRVGEGVSGNDLSLFIDSLINTKRYIDFTAESLLDCYLSVLETRYSPVISNVAGVNILSVSLRHLLETGICDSQKMLVHQVLDEVLGNARVDHILSLMESNKVIPALDFGAALLVTKVLGGKITPHFEYYPGIHMDIPVTYRISRSSFKQNTPGAITFIHATSLKKPQKFRAKLDADPMQEGLFDDKKVLPKPAPQTYCGFKPGFLN